MNSKEKKLLMLIFMFLINLAIATTVFAEEPVIYSPSAILIDSKSGEVLYEKNANSLMYPASTTKVLTAIIAIESCPLDTKITASHDAITSIKSGYTNAAIQVGETLTMEQLLYALMLNSANEAANVIAEYIGGTTENFANIMNAKAIELGCKSTHFVNANGIHSDEHYTTASDLATITRYCMKNETFRKIAGALTYELPATEQYPSNDRILRNTNSLMLQGHKFYYPYAIGIKTGFTSQAKNCLISASQKNGLELISIVLHAESTEDGRSARYMDTINLLEYGNNNYKSACVFEKGRIAKTIEISNDSAENRTLNIVAKDDIWVTLKLSETLNPAPPEITLISDISAPIEKGTVLGKATYTLNEKTYSCDLIAESNVELATNATPSKNSKLIIKTFLTLTLGLVILGTLLLFIKSRIILSKSKDLKKRANSYLNS